MLNFCTYSDKKYVWKGLALNRSLMETMECDYVLHYLCLDDETYNAVKNYPNIIAKHIRNFIRRDIERATQLPSCEYGNSETVFLWAMASIWINHCLKNFVKENETLIYADADIYFYSEIFPHLLLRDKSVGIHRHGFTPPYDMSNPAGEFNVGVMLFKNDYWGNHLCECWKNWILNTAKPDYKIYGTCGDQKWLDKLYLFFSAHISVFDDFLTGGYLAPWNWDNYDDISFAEKKIHHERNNSSSHLLFYHFSHFHTDFSTWSSSNKGEWKPEAHGEVKKIYEHYFAAMKEIKSEYDKKQLAHA